MSKKIKLKSIVRETPEGTETVIDGMGLFITKLGPLFEVRIMNKTQDLKVAFDKKNFKAFGSPYV